jgi:hypothetical protein
LRASEVVGIVGSNVFYAPFQETGSRYAYWPPLSALETWARRHGTTAFVVARAIARRGVKARRFLQEAFEKNKNWIMARIERGIEEAIK